MKKIVSMLLVCVMVLLGVPGHVQAAKANEDLRAVWISTVYNIDYPSTGAVNNPAKQQAEYIALLDELQAIGMNAVFVQVRPKADAFYQSAINPWSDILTGKQGQYPGYDPMAFMIEEAHKRGMEFHAWLNPYRVTTSGTDVNALATNHPARLNPEWTIAYNGKLYYNPALEAVQQHIVDTVTEILVKYDVDGIHFDDYFYPSNYPLPEGEDKDGAVANARREDINDMVRKVSEAVDIIKPDVAFGISPIGIWKNKKSDSQGSHTTGGEGYYTVYADAKSWIENEWIDYIIPQIYWERGHAAADYNTLVKWWSNLVSDTNVKLYIGQGIYKDIIAEQIESHLLENMKYDEIQGNAYFSAKDLIANRQGVATTLTTLYQTIGPEIDPEPTPDPEEPTIPEPEPTPAPIYKKGTVTANQLNVRSGADSSYPSLGKLAKGDTVKILEVVGGGWYGIQLANGSKGYVSGEYIELSKEIRLVINGKQIEPSVAPVLTDGTTLVPLRIISEELGAKVDWEPQKKEAIITDNGIAVSVTIGQKTALVNDQQVTMPLAPALIQDTTMVPIRFIAESLGIQIDWEPLEKIVQVFSKN